MGDRRIGNSPEERANPASVQREHIAGNNIVDWVLEGNALRRVVAHDVTRVAE